MFIVVDDDVADVNADAKFDPEFRRYAGVLLSHLSLDFHRTARGIDSTSEFDQHAIAGGLDDATAVRGDPGIDNRLSKCLQLRECALLVETRRHLPPAPPPVAVPLVRRAKNPLDR